MSDPTDRERVAQDLCAQEGGACQCLKEKTAPCSYMLAIAARAIALGAKPPVDPVETLAEEVGAMVDNWFTDEQSGTDENVWKLGGRIVRHVLARAKEMGL